MTSALNSVTEAVSNGLSDLGKRAPKRILALFRDIKSGRSGARKHRRRLRKLTPAISAPLTEAQASMIKQSASLVEAAARITDSSSSIRRLYGSSIASGDVAARAANAVSQTSVRMVEPRLRSIEKMLRRVRRTVATKGASTGSFNNMLTIGANRVVGIFDEIKAGVPSTVQDVVDYINKQVSSKPVKGLLLEGARGNKDVDSTVSDVLVGGTGRLATLTGVERRDVEGIKRALPAAAAAFSGRLEQEAEGVVEPISLVADVVALSSYKTVGGSGNGTYNFTQAHYSLLGDNSLAVTSYTKAMIVRYTMTHDRWWYDAVSGMCMPSHNTGFGATSNENPFARFSTLSTQAEVDLVNTVFREVGGYGGAGRVTDPPLCSTGTAASYDFFQQTWTTPDNYQMTNDDTGVTVVTAPSFNYTLSGLSNTSARPLFILPTSRGAIGYSEPGFNVWSKTNSTDESQENWPNGVLALTDNMYTRRASSWVNSVVNAEIKILNMSTSAVPRIYYKVGLLVAGRIILPDGSWKQQLHQGADLRVQGSYNLTYYRFAITEPISHSAYVLPVVVVFPIYDRSWSHSAAACTARVGTDMIMTRAAITSTLVSAPRLRPAPSVYLPVSGVGVPSGTSGLTLSYKNRFTGAWASVGYDGGISADSMFTVFYNADANAVDGYPFGTVKSAFLSALGEPLKGPQLRMIAQEAFKRIPGVIVSQLGKAQLAGTLSRLGLSGSASSFQTFAVSAFEVDAYVPVDLFTLICRFSQQSNLQASVIGYLAFEDLFDEVLQDEHSMIDIYAAAAFNGYPALVELGDVCVDFANTSGVVTSGYKLKNATYVSPTTSFGDPDMDVEEYAVGEAAGTDTF